MTQNFLPFVGVDDAHWAPLTTDPAGGPAVYGSAQPLPGLVNVAFTANSQTGAYYADNGPFASAAQLGDMTFAVQSADLPPAVQAIWFGQSYENGGLSEGQINPIEMAFAYRKKKSNGAYRYVRFLKAKPGLPDDTAATQTGTVEFQDGTVTMQSSMRMSDGLFRQIVDTDDPNLPEGVTAETIAANFLVNPLWMPGMTTEG